MQGRQVLAEGPGDGAPQCNVVLWALGGVRGVILYYVCTYIQSALDFVNLD